MDLSTCDRPQVLRLLPNDLQNVISECRLVVGQQLKLSTRKLPVLTEDVLAEKGGMHGRGGCEYLCRHV